MLINVIKHILIILVLAIIQLAVIPNISILQSNINIALIVLVFIAVVYEFYLAVIYGIVLGFIFDLYSVLPFGVITILLMLTLYLVYQVFLRSFTNKSFYTMLGLILIATLIYNMLSYFYIVVIALYKVRDMVYVQAISWISLYGLMWQLLFNTILTIIIFCVFHLISQRFRAVYIDTSR